jgi:glycerol-3-phosphate dehydrogenase
LSSKGVERLLDIYGGRAAAIIAHAGNDSDSLRCIDKQATVLAAEVAFAINEEMARTLADIVFRRLMLGLNADQGRAMYEDIATLAAKAWNWDKKQRTDALDALRMYSDSFRIPVR